MSTDVTVKTQLQSLIDKSNAATGNSDTDLTTAVDSLVAGYGQGGDSWYDTFWDTYLDIDTRRTFTYAFYGAGWTDETFKPNKPFDWYPPNVVPTELNVTYVFGGSKITDLAERLSECGMTEIHLPFAQMGNWYRGSTITRLPKIRIDALGQPVDHFAYAEHLETIEELALPNGIRTGFNFTNDTALKNIKVSGNLQYNFNAQWCPLTAESAKSVITHLSNYAGTTNDGKYTLTFSTTTWEYLNAEGEASPNGNTWEEYILDLGWLVG